MPQILLLRSLSLEGGAVREVISLGLRMRCDIFRQKAMHYLWAGLNVSFSQEIVSVQVRSAPTTQSRLQRGYECGQRAWVVKGGIAMFTRILYPTDFSEVSRKALEYVKKLKEAGTREVVIVHIIDEREITRFPLQIAWARERLKEVEGELEEQMEKAAKEELQVIESELKEKGFTVKVRMEKGSPFREILRVEDEEDVSAVVIGSHGSSNIKEMLLGSVSEHIIRHCKKPVLVVKR